MSEDILFDNIYIGHSVEDAKALAAESFDIKKANEKAAEEAAKPKDTPADSKKSPLDLNFADDPVHYVKEKFELFVELAKRNPVDAVKFVPEIAGAIGVGAITLLIILVSLVSGGSAAAPSKEEVKAKAQQAKDAAAKTKDQVADAVASGADTVKDEVTKRTGKGSN